MSVPPISTHSLWTWNTASGVPFVTGYPSGNSTKTGLQPSDLREFCMIPIQLYATNPAIQVQDTKLLEWIRYAEDYVEQTTNLLLTQTWVASPPAVTPAECSAIGITPAFSGGYQAQGFDYDLQDAAYDFIYSRAQDEGWMSYSLRYKPLRSLTLTPSSPTALKNAAYIYPLLNEFFNVPNAWFIEDSDFAYIRFVPSTNVQMLPLFAMQLAFMGFANSVPGGIWLQYTAGLTPTDYSTRFSFVKQLVLALASITALKNCQGTVNLGIDALTMQLDGVTYSTKYNPRGAFAGPIDMYQKQADELMTRVINSITGPQLITL